jgi:ribonucleoside-diphosphate reductase alpha chain
MDDIYWLNKDSRQFLERGYLLPGENPEQRIIDIANKAQEYLGNDGWAEKFINYMHKGFYSLSSPIWSNFGRDRGLPISCFGSYIPDDMEKILGKIAEVGTMSKVGGGTSAYFGDVRSRGAEISSGGSATGVHHQLTVFDSITNYISQSNVRRGSFAAYLPIDHGDIEEFLGIRGEGNSIQDLSIGVTISDEWMKEMEFPSPLIPKNSSISP